MTGSHQRESTRHRLRAQFGELLKVQGKLALREPYALLGGIGLPIILLLVFGFIGQQVPGNVGSTGLTIIDIWTPTILVIAFIFISVSLPNILVRDREIGWLRRISTTPLHPSRLLAAQLIIDLILAAVAVLIIILGGALLFGASLHLQILPFAVSLLLSIAELFALGLMLVALVPTQTVYQGCARFGVQWGPIICGVADYGRLHGHLRVHRGSLFPLGVAHRRAQSIGRRRFHSWITHSGTSPTEESRRRARTRGGDDKNRVADGDHIAPTLDFAQLR